MDEPTYLEGVKKTWNFNERQLTQDQMMLNAAAMGLAGEAGEFLEDIKKWCHHGVVPDFQKLKKELGDVRYYYTIACYLLCTDDDEIKTANNLKLRLRYPEGFQEGGGIR